MDTAGKPPVTIRSLSFRDVPKAIGAYASCSAELQDMMMGAWPLTTRLGKIHLFLSATPFRILLPIRIKTRVVIQDDEIAGMAYIIDKRYKKEKVFGIFVRDAFQKSGFGTLLMREILDGEDDVELNVLEENRAARRMYEKFGFSQEGTVIHMRYRGPKDKDL